MSAANISHLSRRESQIMEIIYQLGEATASEVHDRLPDRPSYSAVRAMLRVLEEKGHLDHRQDGPRYMFQPTVPAERLRSSALERVVRTFFNGSAEGAVAALLDLEGDELDQEALNRLSAMIERARKEGR